MTYCNLFLGSQLQSPLQRSVSPDLDTNPETEPEEKSSPEAEPDPEDSRRDSDHECDASDVKDDKPGDTALTDVQPPSPDTEPAGMNIALLINLYNIYPLSISEKHVGKRYVLY